MSRVKKEIADEIFAPARKNFPRRKVVLKGLNDLIGWDIMEMQDYARDNKNYRYCLVAINCFSKFGYVRPLLNKTAKATAEAASDILRESKRNFKNSWQDEGKEFLGQFKKLMEERGINMYITYSGLKNVIIERFIRSLKNKIYRSFLINSTQNYIDVLPQIVDEYNSKKHRTIGMSPKEGEKKKNEKLLLSTVYKYEKKFVKPRYNIGSFVRISRNPYIFSKGFWPSYSVETFKIHQINRKYPTSYILSNMDGTEIIKGSFMEPELKLAKHPDVFLIEKILKKKKDRVLVRWLNHDASHDSWVKLVDLM